MSCAQCGGVRCGCEGTRVVKISPQPLHPVICVLSECLDLLLGLTAEGVELEEEEEEIVSGLCGALRFYLEEDDADEATALREDAEV